MSHGNRSYIKTRVKITCFNVKVLYLHINLRYNIQITMIITLILVIIKNVTLALTDGTYNVTIVIYKCYFLYYHYMNCSSTIEVTTTNAIETIFRTKVCRCIHYRIARHLNVPVGFLASVLLVACSDFGAGMFSFRSI